MVYYSINAIIEYLFSTSGILICIIICVLYCVIFFLTKIMELCTSNLKRADEYTKSLVLSNNQLKKVMEFLEKDFNEGLSNEENAIVKMLLTYVREVPQGNESGRFLALDLGGTNFRVLMIHLHGDKTFMTSDIYEIPEKFRHGDSELLFDHIAECLINFIVKHKLQTLNLSLGFTFSFPCIQKGLREAYLVTWTKGYDCKGVEGKDVVNLLNNSLKQKAIPLKIIIDIVAIINDTTGTLMSCAYLNPECRIGLIVGTGCNACYMERLDRIPKWKLPITDPKQVIVNTELGAFGDNGVFNNLGITTKWDRNIDDASINKGKQTFEKMISGMYLGEIVRCVLISLIQMEMLFNGNAPEELLKKNSFLTKYVSKIDYDIDTNGSNGVKHIFDKHFNKTDLTQTDISIIQLVNRRVSQRAAHLAAAACATMINRMQRKDTTIGYDGSVLRYHPYFSVWMEQKIKDLVDEKYNFDLMLSEDGSGRGAALVAASSVHYRGRSNSYGL